MSIGKNPHRPEGKADTDNEHMQAAWKNSGPPHDASRDDKARAQKDLKNLDSRTDVTESGDQGHIGGSRPGVESRVKSAIEHREEREAQEEQQE